MKKILRNPVFYSFISFCVLFSLLTIACGKSSTTRVPPKKTSLKVDTSKVSVTKPVQITAKNLNTISRYGAGVYLTAGDDGTILTTANGGLNWTARVSGTVEKIFASAVLNYDIMIVAGANGTILRSSDKGITWSNIPSGTVKDIKSLSFIDNMTGYAAGEDGLVLSTTTGGTVWASVIFPDIISLNSVSFVGSTGWIAADLAKVYKTTDGGVTWSSGILPATTANMYGISFHNLTSGVVVGDSGKVFETTTGGASWTVIASGTTNKLNGVHVVNNRLAYIVGNNVIIRKDVSTATMLLNDPAYVFNAVDPSPYISGIYVGDAGAEGGVTVSGCDASVMHTLDFEDVSESTGPPKWKISISINRTGTHNNLLRAITPGYTLNNSALSGWVENDSPPVGDPTIIAHSTPDKRIYSNLTEDVLNDYIDINLTQYNTSATSVEIPTTGNSVILEYILTPNPNNPGFNGSFQFYFSNAGIDDRPSLSNEDYCHSITFYLTE